LLVEKAQQSTSGIATIAIKRVRLIRRGSKFAPITGIEKLSYSLD